MLTITEIARRINIPDSTARYYRDQFEDWLPVLGSGRDRRYGEEAVEVLRFVAESARARIPVELIKQRLDERFPVVTMPNEPQPPATTDNSKPPQETALAPSPVAMFALVVKELLAEQRDEAIRETRALRESIDQLRSVVADSAAADRNAIAEQAQEIGRLQADRDAEQRRAEAAEAELAALKRRRWFDPRTW